MPKVWVAVMIATVAVLGPVSPAEARWNRALPRDAYVALGRCETGGERGNTAHRTRSYVGAFGFAKTTWDAYADTPHQRAHRLTWEQQARVLDRVFFYGHTENGRRLAPAGPWGHGCYKKLEWVQLLVCQHGKYAVRRWCR